MPFKVPALADCEAVHFRLIEQTGAQFEAGEVQLSLDAQKAMLAALEDTRLRLDAIGEDLALFEVSDGVGGACKAPLDAPWATVLREWHALRGVPQRPELLRRIEKVKFVQTLIVLKDGTAISAMRPARSTRSLARKRQFILLNEILELQTQPMLALDEAFDLVVVGNTIYILSRTSLDQICDIDKRLLQLAPEALDAAAKRCPGIDWKALGGMTVGKRTIRALFAAAGRADLTPARLPRLREYALARGIELIDDESGLRPADGHLDRFLKLLDGRLYTDELGEQPRPFISVARKTDSATPRSPAARQSKPRLVPVAATVIESRSGIDVSSRQPIRARRRASTRSAEPPV